MLLETAGQREAMAGQAFQKAASMVAGVVFCRVRCG
jgi:hypothetical protein